MSNAERFARLFRGFTARYGRYDITGEATPEQKVAGKARTVDEEITDKDYADHVAGRVGIGVIPLKADNTVNFAAIDIDVYKQADQEKRKLTHSDIALALRETPLIVTKSKSGGIHVWLFSADGVSARLATDYLQSWAAHLGVSGTEVFPKQTERASDDDVGNWINLPYFGSSRRAVIPNKVGTVFEFIEADLDTFLLVAEHASAEVTDDWLIENTKLPVSQRETGETTEEWFDGPPCLQALIVGHPERRKKIEQDFKAGKITEDQRDKQLNFTLPQLSEGARDITFFNAAIYLRRRLSPHDPDAALEGEDKTQLLKDLERAHDTWGRRLFGEESWSPKGAPASLGIANDLPRIAKQGSKGKWGYACTKEPLKSFCNRRLCMKRKFGIGTAINDTSVAITGFTIVNTEDKQYYMTIGDKRIHIPDVATLLSQSEFGRIVTNATNRVWIPMQDTQYRKMMDELLQNADEIDGPPDADRRSMLLNALRDFVYSKKIERGKNDSSMFSGRVLWSADETEAWFKFDQFITFIRARGLQYKENVVASMLTQDFSVLARGNTEVAGRQVRPYVVNLKRLNDLISDEGSDGEA
ncbi:primase [Pseudanabaena phage Pan1]|nr:primase [Pseudanabaena phage Pan1]